MKRKRLKLMTNVVITDNHERVQYSSSESGISFIYTIGPYYHQII